ncbi:MAG: hypothetical protein PHX08_04255 [Lachnospiraceae bacterium]|nr:hypothetical protein [Lachnospiraceae bacterium]
MTKEEIFNIIQEAMDNLFESGMTEEGIIINDNTVLIGPDTVLDSVAFVTLFMDLEEKFSDATGKEIFLLIDEIHEFNPEDTFLTVKVLVDYMTCLLEKE